MNPKSSAMLLCLLLGSTFTLGQDARVRASTARMYEVVIETGMPHLEENLRYATTREQTCLDRNDLARAFPVLHDPSLQDCRLVLVAQRADSASYALQCTGGHGTTGEARWQFDVTRISGTLSVKLGGKNMTFYQRITGSALGACPVAPSITSWR